MIEVTQLLFLNFTPLSNFLMKLNQILQKSIYISDNSWLPILSYEHFNLINKDKNNIRKCCSSFIIALLEDLSTCYLTLKHKLFHGKSYRKIHQHILIICYLDTSDINVFGAMKFMQSILSKDFLDGKESSSEIIKTPECSGMPDVVTSKIHDILSSPRMFMEFLCQIVNRLHLAKPLPSPMTSIRTKFSIKGSTPNDIKKRQVGDPLTSIFVVLGWSGDDPTDSIEMFDTSTQKWSYFQRYAPIFRAYHGVALVDNEMYIVGGFNGRQCKDSTLSLNIHTQEWTRRCAMSIPRCYVSTAVDRGLIYAIGGHSGSNRLKSCEVLEPRKDQWYRIADMMYRRSDAAATELNGKIIVSGGFDGFNFHSTVEIYDPIFDEWTLICRLTYPRSGHSMISMDGHIYALGGFNGSERMREVEKFDEESNCWQTFAPLLKSRSNFSVVVFQDEIYAIGGYDGTSTIGEVERFDKTQMKWQRAPDLNIHRSACDACVVTYWGNTTACAPNENVPFAPTNIEGQSP